MTNQEEYNYEQMRASAGAVEAQNDRLGVQAIQAIHATQELARQVIADLQAEKIKARAVRDKTNAAIGPADTKELARICLRMADATIDFAKLVIAMGISPGDPPPNGAPPE